MSTISSSGVDVYFFYRTTAKSGESCKVIRSELHIPGAPIYSLKLGCVPPSVTWRRFNVHVGAPYECITCENIERLAGMYLNITVEKPGTVPTIVELTRLKTPDRFVIKPLAYEPIPETISVPIINCISEDSADSAETDNIYALMISYDGCHFTADLRHVKHPEALFKAAVFQDPV